MYINWDNFKANNSDVDGLRQKFENLCRHLFFKENITGNKQFKYLHANPNNPGIETDPIYDEVNCRWIGFQAKFFDGSVNYRDIEDSALKTVKYYKDKLDLVFLYCNKELTLSSLDKTVKILQSANIELQLITDKAILDLVEIEYPYLSISYFGRLALDMEWFSTHSKHMFDGLGERYNQIFNVETNYSDELSLFVHDQRAVDYINAKKANLLNEIKSIFWKSDEHRPYLIELDNIIKTLPNVNVETLYDSIKWKKIAEDATVEYIDNFNKELKKIHDREACLRISIFNKDIKKEDYNSSQRELLELQVKEQKIIHMIGLLDIVNITEREKNLLYGDILSVVGKAGVGKSQLLANEVKQLLDEDREGLLLISGIYYNDTPIHEQIMKNLKLDYSFDDLLNVLETIGERNNRIVPVFIDALNEVWNKGLWKSGLPAIIEKVNNCDMVKLIFSYRPEYEKMLLSESIIKQKEREDILTIYSRGFEDNSDKAVKEFLSYYSIPFTPLEYFGYEMSNPLFLTLYCKTYDGEEVSLPNLYEKLIVGANEGMFKVLNRTLVNNGYTTEDNIIRPLIWEIASYMVSKDKNNITHEELCNLKFWTNYKLSPAVLIKILKNENILYETVYNEEEVCYFFTYDQMNDYYCAKAIVQKFQSKDELRQYLSDNVLGISDGKLKKFYNVELFVNVCALYAEKYGEECIDIIDGLTDEYDKRDVFSRYIDSFQWRDKRYITIDKLYELLKRYQCLPEDLWKMLIGNSVKVSHPLNADYLHRILLAYPLNKRDLLWTIYINTLALDDSNRIVQLVQMYNSGEKLEITNKRQVKLLLTLFGWLLTSSNRWLRDNTSKAMIEILKEHFELCQPLLEMFKDVNDPYVIQRLYGIVFGACAKRTNECTKTYQKLAEYVFDSIFNQDKVYPDILLRDYAKLIIDRFLYEYPDYNGRIAQEIIEPPYKSEPLPIIEDNHYHEKSYEGGMFWLIHSMKFEGMGMYGDFGRYVFQSALHDFDVDDKKIFNYAVYYILDELGYREDYFGEHDIHCGRHDRYVMAKTERIGKKYQWIAMHNILARVSDHCKMIDRWSYPERQDIKFEGAWDTYVRDFDPTLNKNFMKCPEAPLLNELDVFIAEAKNENNNLNLCDSEKSKAWLKNKGLFIDNIGSTLLLKDLEGNEWISLTKYMDTGRKNLAKDKLLVWSWMYAYFISPEQKEALKREVEQGGSLFKGSINSHHQTYNVFNREYPWAKSCKEFNDNAWLDISIPSAEKEPETDMKKIHEIDSCENITHKNEDVYELKNQQWDSILKEFVSEIHIKIPSENVFSVYKEKEVNVKLLYATSDIIWEGEYDASKDETISICVPCAEIIEVLGLSQKEYDGFYYDPDGKLGAYDLGLVQQTGGVVIRRDLMDKFISETGLELIWVVQSEKEIHGTDLSITNWSNWEALYEYDSGKITGETRFMGVRK